MRSRTHALLKKYAYLGERKAIISQGRGDTIDEYDTLEHADAARRIQAGFRGRQARVYVKQSKSARTIQNISKEI